MDDQYRAPRWWERVIAFTILIVVIIGVLWGLVTLDQYLYEKTDSSPEEAEPDDQVREEVVDLEREDPRERNLEKDRSQGDEEDLEVVGLPAHHRTASPEGFPNESRAYIGSGARRPFPLPQLARSG